MSEPTSSSGTLSRKLDSLPTGQMERPVHSAKWFIPHPVNDAPPKKGGCLLIREALADFQRRKLSATSALMVVQMIMNPSRVTKAGKRKLKEHAIEIERQIKARQCKCGHSPEDHYRHKGHCTVCQCNRLRRGAQQSTQQWKRAMTQRKGLSYGARNAATATQIKQ